MLCIVKIVNNFVLSITLARACFNLQIRRVDKVLQSKVIFIFELLFTFLSKKFETKYTLVCIGCLKFLEFISRICPKETLCGFFNMPLQA